MTTLLRVGALGACFLLAACASPDVERVDETTPVRGPTATTGQGEDIQFFQESADINRGEIEIGQLAVQRAQNPEVREYAQRLVSEHAAAQNQLMQLVNTQNLTVEPKIDAAHQQTLNRLQGMQGADFDRAFIDAMVQGHQKAVSKFEMQMREGRDPQAKSYAAETLNVLRSHLESAREIQKDLGGAPNAGGMN